MKRHKSPTSPTGNWRPQAEKRLKEKGVSDADDLSQTDARAVVHELQMHQIELEMQNEELHRAQAEAQEALQKYAELFGIAPVSYFQVDQDGVQPGVWPHCDQRQGSGGADPLPDATVGDHGFAGGSAGAGRKAGQRGPRLGGGGHRYQRRAPHPDPQFPEPAAHAFVSVNYRGHWFWVDDWDLKSKRAFSFMMMLFTLADTGEKENLPLITIPAQ